MGHRVIIIESATPDGTTAVTGGARTSDGETYSVRVEFKPADGATPAQIGNEVARIQRFVNRIIEGSPD